MKKPVIELKKVKTFRGMEGTGLNADVYVNGVKTCMIIDDATGGDMQYEVYNQKAFDAFKAYAASLPPEKWKGDDGKQHTIPQSIDFLIDDVFNAMMAEKEKERFTKSIAKKFINHIVFGIPGADGYRYVKFNRPLNEIPKAKLQEMVDKYKAKLGKGESFFNTNFKQLGINI